MRAYLTIDTSDRSHIGVATCEDSAGDDGADARADGWSVRAGWTSPDSRHHAETLAPMVSQVLGEAGIERPDAIVVGTGPGAFTGLRAGIMTARMLAQAWKVPIVGIGSLEAMALEACRAGAEEVFAVIDARRGELFALRARGAGRDDVEVFEGPEIVKPSDVPALLAERPATLVASRPGLYPDILGEAQVFEPTADAFAALAQARTERAEAGEAVELGTAPLYLRRPDIHGGGVPQPAA